MHPLPSSRALAAFLLSAALTLSPRAQAQGNPGRGAHQAARHARASVTMRRTRRTTMTATETGGGGGSGDTGGGARATTRSAMSSPLGRAPMRAVRMRTPTMSASLETSGTPEASAGAMNATSGTMSAMLRRTAQAAGQLRSVRAGQWRTRYGLSVDRGGLRNLLRHTARPRNLRSGRIQGVFDGGRHGAVATVDEAWGRIRGRQSGVVSQSDGPARVVHLVDLGRRVGVVEGWGPNARTTRFVRVIVENGRLVTAHPALSPRDAEARQNERQAQAPDGRDPSQNNLGRFLRNDRGSQNPGRRGRRGRTEFGSGDYEPDSANDASQVVARPAPRVTNIPRRNYPENVRSVDDVRTELRNAGIAERADQAVDHVRLGMPTPARTNTRNDFLMARRGYVASYNESLRIPNWSAWVVRPADVRSRERRLRADDFRADAELPEGMERPTPEDYRHSGWTRGHMVSSGSRQRSPEDNSETFLMTNMVPQAERNNGGAWNHLENYTRALADSGMEVHVFAGGAFTRQTHRTIGSGVAVPDTTWKVVVALRPGQSANDIGPNTRVIAVNMPNTNRMNARESFAEYRTSVAEIERITGFQFFTNVPANVARALRDHVDREPIPSP